MIQEKIQSENAPQAIGPYSPAVKAGDFIFLSGQIPVDPKTGELIDGDIRLQTEQVLKNMQALLQEMDIDLKYVLKTTVFLTDMNDFGQMNEVYAQYFSEPYPARSAVQVGQLPKGAKVEIEAFAIDTRAIEVICSEESCRTCSDRECGVES
jgi:2-iminobutanoate/2-iminopropanoate deaminase